MLYDRNGKLYTGPVNYDMGGPRDYYGNYLSYEAPRPRPISQPSRPSSSSNFSWGSTGQTSSLSNEDKAVFIAGVTIAAGAGLAMLLSIPYHVSKFILDQSRGEDENNDAIAAVITAGVYALGLGSYLAYAQYQNYMVEKYPYVSVQIDGKMRIHAGYGHTQSEAISNANRKCAPGIFQTCTIAALIPGREKACASVAIPAYRKYAHDVFFVGEEDSLLAEKENFGFYAVASHLSGQRPNFSLDRMSEIHYFCNNEEMRNMIPEWEKRYDDVVKTVSDLKKEPLVKKNTNSLNDTNNLTTRPANAAAIAADPSIQPIFDETVTSAAPSESPALRDYFRVTASTLNIREGAGTNNGVEGKLARGSCVSVERGADDVRGFLEIMAQSANGTKIDGYVSAQYLSAIRPAPEGCVATFR